MDWKFEKGRIYSEDENGELLAEATYTLVNDSIVDVNHTFVNPRLQGQGIASSMMEVVVNHLKEEGLKATATCTYAEKWFNKNTELSKDVYAKQKEQRGKTSSF